MLYAITVFYSIIFYEYLIYFVTLIKYILISYILSMYRLIVYLKLFFKVMVACCIDHIFYKFSVTYTDMFSDEVNTN